MAEVRLQVGRSGSFSLFFLIAVLIAFSQTCSLYLSAALLRAILTNHVAHAEASKIAKSLEQNLKLKLEDFEKANKNLELELHRYVIIFRFLSALLTFLSLSRALLVK